MIVEWEFKECKECSASIDAEYRICCDCDIVETLCGSKGFVFYQDVRRCVVCLKETMRS